MKQRLSDLCSSLSCRPVMEVGWNVKLPPDVCVCVHYTDAIPPPQQSRMGGGPSFLCTTSDSHLLQQGNEWREMNEEAFLQRGDPSRDKLWSGLKQIAVLFNTSCCLFDQKKPAELTWLCCPRLQVERDLECNLLHSYCCVSLCVILLGSPADFYMIKKTDKRWNILFSFKANFPSGLYLFLLFWQLPHPV